MIVKGVVVGAEKFPSKKGAAMVAFRVRREGTGEVIKFPMMASDLDEIPEVGEVLMFEVEANFFGKSILRE